MKEREYGIKTILSLNGFSRYTDLMNSTSNKIYQEIGYEQVLESVMIHFV